MLAGQGESGSAAGDPGDRPGAAGADPGRGVRGTATSRWSSTRPTKEWAGAAQRAHRRRLPLRHPRGHAPPRAGRGATSTTATAGSSAGTCRPGTSSCRTWSPPGPSAPRTSTGCSRRCSPASCGTTRSRPSCSTAPLADLGLPVPLSVGAAAARGPRLRRRVVRARRRAEAVAGRRGHRPDRHRPAPRDRPAGRAAAQDRHRWPATGGPREEDADRTGRGRRARAASSPSGDVSELARERRGQRRRRRARAPVRARRAGRGPGAGDGRHRRRDDPAPDDPFRGLYLTDEDVDRLLAARAPGPPRDDEAVREVEQACTAAGTPSRLRELQRACGLTDLDVEILLAALVPDLDARFERLYGYLNDDVTRRRATIGLALEIGGRPADRSRRAPPAHRGAPLVHHLLVTSRTRTAVPDPRRCGCPTGSPRTCSAVTTRTRRWPTCSTSTPARIARRRPGRVWRPLDPARSPRRSRSAGLPA